MITFHKNVHDDHITALLPNNDINFISQLKKDASTQQDDHWAQRSNGEMSPEVNLYIISLVNIFYVFYY